MATRFNKNRIEVTKKTFELPVSLLKRLKDRARQDNSDDTSELIEAIEKHLNNHQKV